MSIKTDDVIEESNFVVLAEAGETLATRDAVYISPVDGEAYKCDADDLQKIGFVGFVVTGVAAGATVRILTHGIMTGFSALTVGATYYVSGTAGGITATKPANYKIAAIAMTATTVKIADFLTVRTRLYTANDTWTNFVGLKWIDVELVARGGDGGTGQNSGTTDTGGGGGGGGGYSKKRIEKADLGTTETVTVAGATASFGAHCQATEGAVGQPGSGTAGGGEGGIGSGGDLNLKGQGGGAGEHLTAASNGGTGGSSQMGGGAAASDAAPGANGGNYGGGAAGGGANGASGGIGAGGAVKVTEHY